MLRIATFRVAARAPRTTMRSVRTFTGYNGPVAGLTPQQEEVSTPCVVCWSRRPPTRAA